MKWNCLFFYTIFNLSTADIVYVNKSKNWTDARRSCREDYGGYLATLDVRKPMDFQLVLSCMPEGNAWFGNYSVASPPIAITGCFLDQAFPDSNSYTLSKSSASACERKCKGGYFGVKGYICKCLQDPPWSNLSLTPKMCSTECDHHASCGGPNSFTVYHSKRNSLVDVAGLDLNHCGVNECLHSLESSSMLDCTHHYNFSCGNGVTVYGPKTWLAAANHCFNHNNSYISVEYNCSQRLSKYWNGYFSSEEFVFDTEEIVGEPQRVTALRRNKRNVALFDPIPIKLGEPVENKYFCTTENGRNSTDDTVTVCDIPYIVTSEGSIGHTSESTGNKEKPNSTEQIHSTSSRGVIVGVSVGCVVIVPTLITVLISLYRKRRHSHEAKSRHENNSHISPEEIREHERPQNAYCLANYDHTRQPSTPNDGRFEEKSSEPVYNETDEGTYDELHSRQNRKQHEETNNYYSRTKILKNPEDEENLYDSSRRDRARKSDIGDNEYSGFGSHHPTYNATIEGNYSRFESRNAKKKAITDDDYSALELKNKE